MSELVFGKPLGSLSPEMQSIYKRAKAFHDDNIEKEKELQQLQTAIIAQKGALEALLGLVKEYVENIPKEEIDEKD